MDVKEEIDILGATFCGQGEGVEILATKPWYTIRVSITVQKGTSVSVNFELQNYPSTIPKVHLVEGGLLSRQCAEKYAEKIAQTATENLIRGQPMLYQLCTIVQEEFFNFLGNGGTDFTMGGTVTDPEMEVFVSLTEIDHMRDKKNYMKILTQWSDSLQVFGRIVFLSNLKRKILMILFSNCIKNLKTFHNHHRTQIVDVDSSGRPCKERQMKVLFPPAKVSAEIKISDLQLIEIPCDSFKSLEEFLLYFDLLDEFKNFLP